ncbi:ABC transporter permease [Fulvivirgaceae bacterium PWU4]|uniref:ABC transporter permease n=1 Tax=Chryseosolibacter histidini TaxID=2782349 RepID=A0AAP2GNE3_9BACT|nr:ABC transporter permease [Chryseosolibacter histidini]MBT1696820.1 ABC transporter permease [Chryseosolibacter histidini]
MVRNYFKMAWCTLKNQWQNNLVNITGLATGMMCCIFTMLYVRDERSYDRYHHNAERIYRVIRTEINSDGQRETWARTVRAIAFTLSHDLPEVEAAAAIYPCREMAMRHAGKQFLEARVLEADSNLFSVFTFPFIKGTPAKALKHPQSIVIAESVARRYFGTAEPIGQVISSEQADYYVTGVIKDIPANAHFHFDMLIPLRTLEVAHNTQWLGNRNYLTYVKVKAFSTPAQLEEKLRSLALRYSPSSRDVYGIQPLTSIHLTSALNGELEPNSDAGVLQVVTIIALFVMIIAGVNYVNLATAQGFKRAKEVGIRKTSGASRLALAGQFLTESVLTAVIAFVLALLMTAALLHPFNQLSGKQFALLHLDLPWIYLTGFAVAIGLLAGLYPALLLSAFSPVKVLKGASSASAGTAWLRKCLVIFQFTISIGLTIAVIVIVRQMDYIARKDPGFQRAQVIIVHNADRLSNRQVLEQEIKQLSAVAHVGASTAIIGKGHWTTNIRTGPAQPYRLIDFCQINYEYLDALGIRLLMGRKFSSRFPADTINTIILNQTAVKELGLEAPVGQQLIWNEGGPDTTLYASVVGVVDDFHYASFHEAIRPFAFLVRNSFFVQGDFTSNLFIRINGGRIPETIRHIEKIWMKHVPQRPFTYRFMDDSFRELHAADERFEGVVSWLTALAMFIACLGVFALVTFMMAQRTKEIGIRKVLGASSVSIVVMINKDLIRMVLLALAIATPIALHYMDRWLQGFAYRTEITWWIFLLTGAVTLGIVLATTAYQSIRASRANPVISLRTE